MRGIRRFSCRLSHHPVSCAQFTKMWNITGTRIHLNTRGTEPWAQGSLIPGSNYSAQVLFPRVLLALRLSGARRCLAVPYVLRLGCSWLLWPGVAMPCFARALVWLAPAGGMGRDGGLSATNVCGMCPSILNARPPPCRTTTRGSRSRACEASSAGLRDGAHAGACTNTPTHCIPKPPQTVPEAFDAWLHALPVVCG